MHTFHIRTIALALAAAFGLGLSGATLASDLKPEDAIKFRKAGYNFMSWNMGKIKASVEGTFNRDEVVRSAQAIAAVANSGMGALYLPGTDRDHGDQKTRLKSEFFQEPERVREIAMNFNAQANELAKVAASGNPTAVAAQFKRVGDSCKACHDRYRAK